MSDDKIGFKYLASKYLVVFIANKIGRNSGLLLVTVYTFGLPHKIQGAVPTGQILSNSFKYYKLLANITKYIK